MKKIYSIVLLLSFTVLLGQPPSSQSKDLKFIFEPDSLSLNIGEEASVLIRLVDADGNLANNPFYVYGRPRRALESKPRISDSTGVAVVTIKAFKPGKLGLSVRSIAQKREDRVMGNMPIEVPFPPLDRIVFNDPISNVYVGTSVNYKTEVFDKANLKRTESKVLLTSSDADVAEFDSYGNLVAKKSGKIQVVASVDDIKESLNIKVSKNPVRKISLTADKDEIRTGDVLQLELPSMKIKKVLKFKKGAQSLIIGGSHVGMISTIKDEETTRSTKPNLVMYEGFQTIRPYSFIVGEKKSMVSLPEVKV